MTGAAPIAAPKNKRQVKGALPQGCDRRSAHQSLFNIIQSLADFEQDKSIRVILIDIRHIPIEDRTIVDAGAINRLFRRAIRTRSAR